MFREMLRKKQQLDEKECIGILKKELRGVLSVIGDEGYPYGMPINHYYCEEDGKIYFHGGRTGHKVDALRKNDRVSLCIYDQGVRNEGEWFLTFRSVIVFGRCEEVKDHEKALEISRQLSYKFTDDDSYIEEEIVKSGPGTLCFAITPEHISGKLVRER
jgi:nitroimidazol reductase NimA-like FMN-containing flavoprotein (pyridoxamine 5'-phosphate oxidase superfamily)